MSHGVGVDVGASVVKVGTADSAEGPSAQKSPREIVFPQLIARVGTQVPHVRVTGHAVLTRTAQDLFVDEVLEATARLSEVGPADGADTMIIAPDWWTAHACDSIRGALHEAGMTDATLVPSAIAAVRGYQDTAPSMPSTVAVLDLGAHSCSAAIVTGCDSDDIARVGHASVVHGRGGNDLDARLLHHVLGGLRAQGHFYRHDDAEAVEAARALLVECRSAKEVLSIRPVATMSPQMPGSAAQLRLVRAEHDDVARPAVREIVQVLKDCITAGSVDVDAVLLIGGGAPIPIVTQQISVELGLPVLLDADPSTLAVRGAALEALAAEPLVRGEANRLFGRGARRPWSRRSPVTGSRRRGRRAGVTAAYLVVALLATGAPAPSPAAGAMGLLGSGMPTGSLDADTSPDDRPSPPSEEAETQADTKAGIDPRLTQLPSSPADPTETSVPSKQAAAPDKATKPSRSSSSSGSGSNSTSSAQGSGATPSTPPSDPPSDPPTDEPPPATDGPGGEGDVDVQP